MFCARLAVSTPDECTPSFFNRGPRTRRTILGGHSQEVRVFSWIQTTFGGEHSPVNRTGLSVWVNFHHPHPKGRVDFCRLFGGAEAFVCCGRVEVLGVHEFELRDTCAFSVVNLGVKTWVDHQVLTCGDHSGTKKGKLPMVILGPGIC